MKNGSYVFTCFEDFNKAFDSIDYRLLFSKLIDSTDSICMFLLIQFLAYSYEHS